MYIYVVPLTVCIVYILDYKYTLALYSHLFDVNSVCDDCSSLMVVSGSVLNGLSL
jgi:hypothetical protein